MSAECKKCGWDLDMDLKCIVCALEKTIQAQDKLIEELEKTIEFYSGVGSIGYPGIMDVKGPAKQALAKIKEYRNSNHSNKKE